MSWRERAVCADPRYEPDWWFPGTGTDPMVTQTALNLCSICPVQELCESKYDGGYGIWGGKIKKVWIDDK